MKALDEMIGNTYVNKKDGVSHHFLSYKIKNEDVTIVTNKEWFVKHISEVTFFLELFTLTKNENKAEVTVFVQKNRSHFDDVKAIIKANIQKVQEDKTYIPQASEVNNQIKSLIEISKMEIEAFKIIRGQ